MADVFSPEKRSEVMSLIRGRDTKPELALRSMLHRLGYRFTVNGPKNRSLPGKPDIVLPKYKTVVFVHGCFWHGHQGCPGFKMPQTRTEWWTAKIEGNRSRDIKNQRLLESTGWRVVVVWACRIRNRVTTAALQDEMRTWFDARPPVAKVAEDPVPYRASQRKTKPIGRASGPRRS
jgi:DNA mismatch endonuclease (patch repair protein)